MKKGRIWLVVSLILIIVLSVITKSDIIQIVATVFGVIYVFGTAEENRYGQLFGVVNAATYGVIMYNNHIYGTAIYDILYCVPLQIYTFFAWGKKKNNNELKLKISKYSITERLMILLIVEFVAAIYYFVASKLNVDFALIDGFSIILGIFGLYFTSKKKIEQWYMYILSNVVMIVLWSIKITSDISTLPMLLMWVIYLINNSYGLYSWSKKYNENLRLDEKEENA